MKEDEYLRYIGRLTLSYLNEGKLQNKELLRYAKKLKLPIQLLFDFN